MSPIEIENNLNTLVANLDEDRFVFDLLLAYGTPKSTIKRLEGSDHDRLATHGELSLRKKLFFKVAHENLHSTIDSLKTQKEVTKHSPRFIIVTDYETLLAYDTKTDDSLDTELLNIINHYDFFLPLAGMEKTTFADENPADVKASLKMAKLYDELQKNNHFETKEDIHALNVFLTRLLFCYFAEDTNIFPDNAVTNSISSHTALDGSDVDSYLSRLFKIFNIPQNQREANTPAYLDAFPYVNGGLFRDEYAIPKFTTKSRNILLEIGQLNWSQINPDIFGSMIQAVITPEHRGGMGMHYTSVPNIMKVIEPLFLDELYSEFEKAYDNKTKLQDLLNRIAKIKIFDPACGSGNFLIIAYKKLRGLEIEILKRINALSNIKQGDLFGKSKTQLSFLSLASRIELTQFYGIELDDFAHEVALLSLWIAEHQMNKKFYDEFGQTAPSLPLKSSGNIVQGNATRLEWAEVCPKEDEDEIFVLGNPPYLGGKLLSEQQKNDTHFVFSEIRKYENIDYIGCWFYKVSNYLTDSVKSAFVSTNSIVQGTQVNDLWPHIFSKDIEIHFAVKDFIWSNNAKNKAGVTVVIIGLRKIDSGNKYIFEKNLKKTAKNINAYLLDANNIFVEKRTKPLSLLPQMTQGNIPLENGLLRMTLDEKSHILSKDASVEVLFKKIIGSDEMLNSIEKWCLWITDKNVDIALKNNSILERIHKVRDFRLKGAINARSVADKPHQFCMTNTAKNNQLVIPIVSSEKREYLPISYYDSSYIVLNSALVIYDPEIYIFGLISSKIHRLWVQTFAGKLESRYRYSVGVCWYSFPFPDISQKQKGEITELVFYIIDEREKHSQKTLAQLYDPDKMPEGLRKAHHELDLAIERCYRTKPFESDEERLEYLFKMYEEMTNRETK